MTEKNVTIVDVKNNLQYSMIKCLGRGSFAVCYEVVETVSQKHFACKVIKTDSRTEESIHKKLNHRNIVNFLCCFNSIDNNKYLILELCNMGTLSKVVRSRKCLPAPEVRYYGLQVIEGVKYLHEKKIVHRDLKLANLFLSEEIIVKIGDFGFATVVSEVNKRFTVCGTPNYVAPEILDSVGHGLEVDVWSVGCILFALATGTAPFTTTTKRETLTNVRNCKYNEENLEMGLKALLRRVFVKDPSLRPTIHELQNDEYFKTGYIPKTLPVEALGHRPEKVKTQLRDLTNKRPAVSVELLKNRRTAEDLVCRAYDTHLPRLRKVLEALGHGRKVTSETVVQTRTRLVSVARWVHLPEGFGYQLTDGKVGMLFNDTTYVVGACAKYATYITLQGLPIEFFIKSVPQNIQNKRKSIDNLIEVLKRYNWAGERIEPCPGVVDFVVDWKLLDNQVFMFLYTGTLQVNYQNHEKLVISPSTGTVTELGLCGEVVNVHQIKDGVEVGLRPRMLTALNALDLFENEKRHHPSIHE